MDHLGRFRLGSWLPAFSYATFPSVGGIPDTAIDLPTYETRLASNGTLVDSGVLSLERNGVAASGGPRLARVFLDSGYTVGSYVLIVRWVDSTGVVRCVPAMFDVIPSGSVLGDVVAMSVIQRADRVVAVMATENGDYRSVLNPTIQ